MNKVNVTYKAPPGDSKVVEMFGHTFYDGKTEEIEVDDRVKAKLEGNRHFDCVEAQAKPFEPPPDAPEPDGRPGPKSKKDN